MLACIHPQQRLFVRLILRVQIQYKVSGLCTWLVLHGGPPPEWQSRCGDTPPPCPPPDPVPPPEPENPGVPATCGNWRVRLWQLDGGSGKMTAVALWVRPRCSCRPRLTSKATPVLYHRHAGGRPGVTTAVLLQRNAGYSSFSTLLASNP